MWGERAGAGFTIPKARFGMGFALLNPSHGPIPKGLLPKTSPLMLGWPRGNLFQRRNIRLDFFTRPHGPHRRTRVHTRHDVSGTEDSKELFSACVEGLVPLALSRRNLIAPSEKTSPRPSHNGWVPLWAKTKGDLSNSLPTSDTQYRPFNSSIPESLNS